MRRRSCALVALLATLAAAADTGAPSPAPDDPTCIVELAPGACLTVALGGASAAGHAVALVQPTMCTPDAIE